MDDVLKLLEWIKRNQDDPLAKEKLLRLERRSGEQRKADFPILPSYKELSESLDFIQQNARVRKISKKELSQFLKESKRLIEYSIYLGLIEKISAEMTHPIPSSYGFVGDSTKIYLKLNTYEESGTSTMFSESYWDTVFHKEEHKEKPEIIGVSIVRTRADTRPESLYEFYGWNADKKELPLEIRQYKTSSKNLELKDIPGEVLEKIKRKFLDN